MRLTGGRFLKKVVVVMKIKILLLFTMIALLLALMTACTVDWDDTTQTVTIR